MHEAELKREEELLQRTLMSGTKKPVNHQKPVGLVKAKSTQSDCKSSMTQLVGETA